MPDAEEPKLLFESYLCGPRPIDPWVPVSNGVDFQHLRTLHNIPAALLETIELGPFGLEYKVDGSAYSQHGLIIDANCFAQHLRSPSGAAWVMFTGRAVARGRLMSYYLAGVCPGAGAQRVGLEA